LESILVALATKLSAIPSAAASALLRAWSESGLPPFSSRTYDDGMTTAIRSALRV